METACLHRLCRRENIVGGEGDVLDTGAETFGQKFAGEGLAIVRTVHGQAEMRRGNAFDGLAAYQPARIDHIDHRRAAGGKQRGVKQKPGQHFIIMRCLREMIDAL
ncbi:hypothetical protein D3C72_1401470 [compost metagenome]